MACKPASPKHLSLAKAITQLSQLNFLWPSKLAQGGDAWLALWRYPAPISAGTSTIMYENDRRRFPQTLQANSGIVPYISPKPFPFISFPIHYLLS
jgi:hypothetical protein